MFRDLYPSGLNTEGDAEAIRSAESAVYRLVLRRLSLPGLPEHVQVGDVDVHFIAGPILSQLTSIRQRPGLPLVFDKHMRRAVEIGRDELLTVAHLPVDVATGVTVEPWRSRVRTAIGLLVCQLDERVAGHELSQDIILLRADKPVGAVDVASSVRTFMPFDVTEDDRTALDALASRDLDEEHDYARAAQLYGSATSEGPSRLGFVLLWLAVDALIYERRNQAKELLTALERVDFDLDWLDLSVGRLSGLRGKLAHGKAESDDLVRRGFYDMEAIARALIRHAAALPRAWPAMPSPTAFPLPFGRQIAEQSAAYQEEWHADGLPAPEPDPTPAGLERYDAVRGEHEGWLRIEGTDDPSVVRRLRFWGMAAASAIDVPVGETTIEVCADERLPAEVDFAARAERLLVAPEVAEPADDVAEARLGYQLCRLMAEQQVLRLGIVSDGFGAFLIELAGAWVSYREWVLVGGMPPEVLTSLDLAMASLQDLGAYVGVALAGDEQARNDVERWAADPTTDPGLADLVNDTLAHLQGAVWFADVLNFLAAIVKEIRDLKGGG